MERALIRNLIPGATSRREYADFILRRAEAVPWLAAGRLYPKIVHAINRYVDLK
jgi:hypothetical protein